MAWLAYLIGIVLMMVDIMTGGLLVFLFGMLIHWKFWIITLVSGTIAFFVGAGWSKPSL